MQGPHQDLHNIFSQDLGQKPHTLRTFKTPPTLARSSKKDFPHNSEDLFTRISDNRLKISTAPQTERSDTHKMPRGLRERFQRYQNSHRTTTGAIRHARSHEKVAGFIHFLVEVYKVLRLPRKMSPRQTAAHTLQSKRTWTSHKGTFM